MGCGTSNQASTPQPRSPIPQTPTPTQPPTPIERKLTTDFDSDHIHLQIEKGKDDNQIAPTEENYPPPIPPSDSCRNIRPKDIWFEDEHFENASDDAELLDFYKIETVKDDDEINLDEISDTTSVTGRSTKDIVIRNVTPATVAKSKVAFEEVDAHARSASPILTNSYEDLIKYLSTPLEGDRYRCIKLARAIVMWLSEQKLDFIHGTANMDSPNGLLLFLKDQKMTYSTCYAILCRKAGLSCTILKGYVKAAKYEPGADVVPESTWNAVHVEGGWQLVQTYWVCRALYGHNLGGWVKIEVDGTRVAKREKASQGVIRSTFQEHYFMPKPEEFIYICYAKDTCWQLVKKSLEVHTMKQFLEMPYLLPPFFGLGLQLVSENKCVLETIDGFCKIEFKASNANAHMIVLKYELYKKVSETFEKDQEMTRMVFNSRANENFIFEIRFPCEGTFKLVIYGGPHKSAALRLCEFKLVCTKRMIGYNLLPLECKNIGWGPGPVTFEAGLLMPSRPNGLIPVNKTDRKTDITFLISDKFVKKHEYSANLHGEIDGKRKTFADSVKTILDTSQQKQLMITAVLPTEGEYGLEILHSSDEVRDETICNYLLSTKAYRATKANVKNAKEELKAAVDKNVKDEDLRKKIESIKECITKCQKQKIPNSDEDMCAAFSWLEFYLYKNLLRDCHLRRNIHVTRNVLKAIGRFKNKDALISQITRVEQLENELLELNGHARKVPTLENANRAIVSLKSPSEEVFVTFKALLMLLGTPEKQLDDWGYIQSQLRESTHTEPQSVLGKMKRIQKQAVTLQQRKKVQDLLQKYNEDQVRTSNSDAHSFYVWIQSILQAYGRYQTY